MLAMPRLLHSKSTQTCKTKMLLEHVQLYRRTQANWQSFDAYARVCMSMGTNQPLGPQT